MMPDYKEKELAIKVAEQLGDEPIFWENCQEHGIGGMDVTFYEPYGQYLHRKAAEILFSEGMAAEFYEQIAVKAEIGDGLFEEEHVADWFRGEGTLTPEKILNVWLDMEKE